MSRMLVVILSHHVRNFSVNLPPSFSWFSVPKVVQYCLKLEKYAQYRLCWGILFFYNPPEHLLEDEFSLQSIV